MTEFPGEQTLFSFRLSHRAGDSVEHSYDGVERCAYCRLPLEPPRIDPFAPIELGQVKGSTFWIGHRTYGLHESVWEPFLAAFPNATLTEIAPRVIKGHSAHRRRIQEYRSIGPLSRTFILFTISKCTCVRICKECGAVITHWDQPPPEYFFPLAVHEEDRYFDENDLVVEAESSKCGVYERVWRCDQRFVDFGNKYLTDVFAAKPYGRIIPPGVYTGPRLFGRSSFPFDSGTPSG